MNSIKNSWYLKYLACPDCENELQVKDDIRCRECGYKIELSNPVVIKPINSISLATRLSRVITNNPSDSLDLINIEPPDITYTGPSAIRDSRGLMSEISSYLNAEDFVLDLGCGPRDQANPIEYLGYKYVGVDYSNEKADFLADAHAIPFKKSTFDCVLSYAVLEHLHNPFVAIQEIERVLKPGGIYIGTVSQGEPFHDSYFHITAWGLISLITSVTSLQVRRLWSSGDTLGSLSRMGKYPRVIKKLLRLIDQIHIGVPFLAPRKMKWPKQDKALDGLHRAGSICFVLQKPSEAILSREK